jgi:hypothetical protein
VPIQNGNYLLKLFMPEGNQAAARGSEETEK